MPIQKIANVITYIARKNKWDSTLTGVYSDEDFAICDEQDPTRQLQFQVSSIAANTAVVLTAPAASGTLALSADLVPTIQYVAPLAGDSVTIAAGTLATLTIVLPAAADSKRVGMSSVAAITALTVTPNGADSMSNALTALTAGQAVNLIARSGKWYRC